VCPWCLPLKLDPRKLPFALLAVSYIGTKPSCRRASLHLLPSDLHVAARAYWCAGWRGCYPGPIQTDGHQLIARNSNKHIMSGEAHPHAR
jgi:hypothetical protein